VKNENVNVAEILAGSPARENCKDKLVSEGQLCADCDCEAWYKYSVSEGGEHRLRLLGTIPCAGVLGCGSVNALGWRCRRSSRSALPARVFTWPSCELVWGTDPSEK